jgi:hypothetical protein
MIKPVVQRRVGIATTEVAGHHTTYVIRKQNTDGQTKPNGILGATTPNDLCAKPDQLVGEIRFYRAISGGRSRQDRRDRSRANRYAPKFFVQPMTAVVEPPNLPAHKPTGNCASGDDDRP